MAVHRERREWRPYSDELTLPLGQHVEHDDESRRYVFRPRTTGVRKPVQHVAVIDILDQSDDGTCTGHGGTADIATDPVHAALPDPKPTLDEPFARQLYSDAEDVDGDGPFPPNDNGSSGLSIAKVVRNRKLIPGWLATFSLDAALDALQEHPLMLGTEWLTPGMDEPDANAIIVATGTIRGGHLVLIDEYVPAGSPFGGGAVRADGTPFGNGHVATVDMVGIRNSWGKSFGFNGRIYISVTDLGKLLKRKGDITVLLPLTAPTPTPAPVPATGATFPGSAATAAELARLAAAHGWTGGDAWVTYIEYRFPGDH